MNDLLDRALGRWLYGSGASRQLNELAERLDVPVSELAAVTDDPRIGYRPFTIRKRRGGRRQIFAPSDRLKRLQRRLLHRYLADFPVHHAAMAFRPGHSVASHARRHLGQAVVLTVDLADFFPSTATHRVRRWFRDQQWRDDALQVLMRLCTYRGGLPQGAPTSPALSNLVNLPLDGELAELAAYAGAKYSRYCDDLAFSWGQERETAELRQRVQDRLARFGYQVQAEKGWRLQRRDELPEMTGVRLHGRRLRVASHIAARIRELRRRWWSGLSERETRELIGLRGFRKMLRRR